jgi:NIPSNAP
MITCIIRYHIDPSKKAEFERYARNWGQAIPRCGADLVGYFSPHEGSTTLAYGI